MSRLRYVAVLAVLATGGSGWSETYYIAWEGEGDTPGLPEQFGWTRSWGNWDGLHQGPGAYRTLENGVLAYDSLYDPGVFDFSYIEDPPWPIDPQPGQCFFMDWRVRVEQVVGTCDPAVTVAADTMWQVGFEYSETWVRSVFEDDVYIPIAPGVFHDYRLISWDMLTYEFYIDGELARVGSFWASATASYVGWGDAVQGAASLHRWDRFRFGTLPAPQAGDVDCDGTLDFRDINPFVQALSDGELYQQTHPGCWPENADINGDASVDFRDINPFVELLLSL